MANDTNHHKTKKRRYTLVFIAEDNSASAKSIRFRRWHVVSMMIIFLAISFGLFWTLIVYTPVGQIFPITSPGLRNQYTQQLLELHQRLASVMDELMVLRAYNAKLRKALGEGNVTVDTSKNEKNTTGMNQIGSSISQSSFQSNVAVAASEELKPLTRVIEVQTVDRQYQFPAIFPTQGFVTRGFDPSINHYGIDIAGKSGSLIYATADGTILFSGWSYSDGYVVIISHAYGFVSFYKHNDAVLKSAGTNVKRGEPIALLGNTGETSQGPHLHFEIWKDGVPIDPAAIIINYSI